jgi:hypothetical protein
VESFKEISSHKNTHSRCVTLRFFDMPERLYSTLRQVYCCLEISLLPFPINPPVGFPHGVIVVGIDRGGGFNFGGSLRLAGWGLDCWRCG